MKENILMLMKYRSSLWVKGHGVVTIKWFIKRNTVHECACIQRERKREGERKEGRQREGEQLDRANGAKY